MSRDGGGALEQWGVISVSIIMYVPDPLQPFSWELADPVPAATTGDGVTVHSTGEEVSLGRLH